MSIQTIRKKVGRARNIFVAILLSSVFTSQVTVLPIFAQEAPDNGPADDRTSVIDGFPAYEEGCGDGELPTGNASLGGIDKFLQVLAYKESSGVPTKINPVSGASGKYQYIDSTWAGVTKSNYPPGSKYQAARQAPEEMQDAAAYLEYVKKFKQFDNDIFKIAVSHFLPKANEDKSLLDKVPPGNAITPRQYAQDIINKTKSEGPWTNIKLHYKDAPQFAEYAKKAGVNPDQNNNNLQYVKLNDIIKETGADVGATLYGGRYKDGQWQATNDNQDPENKNLPHEDNGQGYGKAPGPLAGHTAYAELSVNPGAQDFKALGDLKPFQKLAITYNGKTVIAEKRDVGGGGDPIKGKKRAIDLWWETARLLDMKDSDVVTIHGVPDDTPLTPVGGQATDTTSAPDTCQSVCAPSSGQILLDPGHSGADRDERDKTTGLTIGDSSNPAERIQTFKTAEKVKEILTKAGYSVAMTKKKESDYVNLMQRAQMANDMKVALAVSIHSTGGNFGDSSAAWVTPQVVGHYRENPGKHTEFQLKDVAKESQRIAQKIAEARSATGDKVQVRDLNFTGRKELSQGNLSIVQLFSKVPWVYNEVGQNGYDGDKYAKGIADGIMKAIDKKEGNNADQQCSGGQGDIVSKAEALAWHDGRKGLTPRQEYVKAVNEDNPGMKSQLADCGVFVATVMLSSKVDPKFPKAGTFNIEPYLLKEKDKYDTYPNLNSTSQLQPGDIFVVNAGSGSGANGHTYFYIGKHGRFNAASASLNSYMPTYNVTYFSDSRGHYLVGRNKGTNQQKDKI